MKWYNDPTNDESKKMWNEVLVTYFKVLSQHLPEGTEENH
jgi:hypothetical protein